jgi:hypothetical protein
MKEQGKKSPIREKEARTRAIHGEVDGPTRREGAEDGVDASEQTHKDLLHRRIFARGRRVEEIVDIDVNMIVLAALGRTRFARSYVCGGEQWQLPDGLWVLGAQERVVALNAHLPPPQVDNATIYVFISLFFLACFFGVALKEGAVAPSCTWCGLIVIVGFSGTQTCNK